MIVLRVFTAADGRFGNNLGVVLDAEELSPARRQAIAAEAGFPETIFVTAPNVLAIHTPATELPFAGHPLVGAAWLLDQPQLLTPAGPVATRREGAQGVISAPPSYSPLWSWRQLSSPDEVDALEAAAQTENGAFWAWRDEQAGRIRARVFAPELGIVEDLATGSAVMMLCAQLDRPIEVLQGAGCLISARPCGDGNVELAGRVARDD